MFPDDDKKLMKKYRHIIAALIDESIGYFTPSMALYAIECQKSNDVNACEWYYHMATRKLHNSGKTSSEDFDNILRQINHDTIKRAFNRRHNVNLAHSLRIVDYNIEGYKSIGASWF